MCTVTQPRRSARFLPATSRTQRRRVCVRAPEPPSLSSAPTFHLARGCDGSARRVVFAVAHLIVPFALGGVAVQQHVRYKLLLPLIVVRGLLPDVVELDHLLRCLGLDKLRGASEWIPVPQNSRECSPPHTPSATCESTCRAGRWLPRTRRSRTGSTSRLPKGAARDRAARRECWVVQADIRPAIRPDAKRGGRVTGKWWRGWSRCHDPRHLLVIVAIRSEGHARGHHVGHQTHVILRLLARSPSLRLRLGFNALVLSLGAQQRHPWPRGICGIAAVFHRLQAEGRRSHRTKVCRRPDCDQAGSSTSSSIRFEHVLERALESTRAAT